MEFPGGNDNYLTITGPSHPFLSGAETFHTPSLGDEEFEIPPISLDSDPSLAVSDVVGHFDDLADPSSSQDGSFSAQYGVQTLDMPVGMTHGLMEQGGGLLSGGLTMVRGKSLSNCQALANKTTLLLVYKRKTEAAKKEYLKALAAYKDNQECQATVETVELDPVPPSQTPSPPPVAAVDPASPAPASSESPALSPCIVVNSTLSSYVANQASSGPGGQPNITKLIITKQMLPSSITMSQGGMVTVIPATVVTSRGLQLGQTSTATIQPSQQAQIVTRSVLQAAAAAAASMQLPPPRLQPPPLQQMPQPPTQQQVTILQQPPPLQAMQQPPPQKVRINLQQQPPPLQSKIVPPPTLKIQTTLVPPAVENSPERLMNNSPEAHTVEATSPETICEMIADVVPEVESPSQMDVELVSGSPVTLSPQPRCVRSGCENPPVVSKDWDNEYCSNECVVKHCRDVFLAWVASRNPNTVVFVK
ncbi:PREDICTED: TOX high mobility group box family member 4 [Dipodomys ordii]|uniref:TOX high mobility group box family member 4 n=1 Tax=Dipodomys ordii TaxID=10020 RepID=A0A1S3G8H4_DIPOR|nr:PREDICTED: TOX high mobility group box family member 4 [Dipodomys ordii]